MYSQSIGGDVSSSTVAFLRDQDAIRLQRAQEKEEEASKRRKAQRTQRKSAQERLTEQEGVFLLSRSELFRPFPKNVCFAPKKILFKHTSWNTNFLHTIVKTILCSV